MGHRPSGIMLGFLVVLAVLVPGSALATLQFIFSPSCDVPPCANDTSGFRTFLGADATGSGEGPSIGTSNWGQTAVTANRTPYRTDAVGSVNGSAFNSSIQPKSSATANSGGGASGQNNPGTQARDRFAHQGGDIRNNRRNPTTSGAKQPAAKEVIIFALPERCPEVTAGTAPDIGTAASAGSCEGMVASTDLGLWQSSSSKPWLANSYVVPSAAITVSRGRPVHHDVPTVPRSSSVPVTDGWNLVDKPVPDTDSQSSGHKYRNWLVTAYNPALCKNGNCQPDSLSYSSVAGSQSNRIVSSTAASAVPAPSPLFLLAVGLPLIGRMLIVRAKRGKEPPFAPN